MRMMVNTSTLDEVKEALPINDKDPIKIKSSQYLRPHAQMRMNGLTHGRLVASPPGSCKRIDGRPARRIPLPQGRCWDSTADGKGARHSKKV